MGINLYSPCSWHGDNALCGFDFKRSAPILVFCAVILRGLAAGIGAGRAEQFIEVLHGRNNQVGEALSDSGHHKNCQRCVRQPILEILPAAPPLCRCASMRCGQPRCSRLACRSMHQPKRQRRNGRHGSCPLRQPGLIPCKKNISATNHRSGRR